MMQLSLQPPRVPLGMDAAGRPITITREWYRFIEASFTRQGGNEAPTNLDLMLPVGFVMSMNVATNPRALLGYGTWTRFGQGRVLVSLDEGQTEFDTVGETGGAKTHTLTTGEMPSHTHTQDPHTHTVTDPGHTHSTATNSGGVFSTGPDPAAQATTGTTGSATTGISVNAATATNQNAGGGGAHNNLQPYIVVYMWVRTA